MFHLCLVNYLVWFSTYSPAFPLFLCPGLRGCVCLFSYVDLLKTVRLTICLLCALLCLTDLFLFNDWKFILLPSLDSNSSFESHLVTITHPFKIHFVVVYRPPGPQGNFLDELDVLLLTFHEDGTPLVMLGDFNIHLDQGSATRGSRAACGSFIPLLWLPVAWVYNTLGRCPPDF